MRWLIAILVTIICGCGSVASASSSGAGGSTSASVCEPTGATCMRCTSCAISSPCAGLYQTC